jgi:hypothetical protein
LDGDADSSSNMSFIRCTPFSINAVSTSAAATPRYGLPPSSVSLKPIESMNASAPSTL